LRRNSIRIIDEAGWAEVGLQDCRRDLADGGAAVWEGERRGPVAGLVGIEGGVVSGVINLESLGVRAPSRRPRHENRYHEA
jgi:hypothetical protein